LVGESDSRGRKGRESSPYPQAAFLRACFDAASGVDAGLIAQGMKDGREISEALHRQRIEAIKSLRETP